MAAVDVLFAYSATKFAVRGMTQSAGMCFNCGFLCFHRGTSALMDPKRVPVGLALALGKHGITVNAYAPGGVETRIRQSPLSSYEECCFTYWWTVDIFDDFLEPLAGPRAGRNAVRTTGSFILQVSLNSCTARLIDGGRPYWRARGGSPSSISSGLQGGGLHHR